MPFRSHAAPLAALLLTALIAAPGLAATFTDSAGRRVELPDHVTRVLTAGPTADALVFSLAPNDLLGWSRAPQAPYVPRRFAGLPVTGLVLGPDPRSGAEIVRRLHPDLVIDAGPVTPLQAAFADRLQQSTGVPCILVDDTFVRMPTVLRALGQVLGVPDRAENLATYAEHAIDALRGRLLIQPSSGRPRVYYARGPDGLETALPGSPAAATLEEAGAINVAGALGSGRRAMVTRQQVLNWHPDIIIAEQRSFYDAVLRDPAWSGVPAVRNRQVFLAPSSPFGWIDEPPGVNRLIGLYWLSGLFYPDATQENIRYTADDFYNTFYQEKLTDAQLHALTRAARAPRQPGQKAPSEVLLGVGPEPTNIPLPGLQGTPHIPGRTPAMPTMPATPGIPGGNLKY